MSIIIKPRFSLNRLYYCVVWLLKLTTWIHNIPYFWSSLNYMVITMITYFKYFMSESLEFLWFFLFTKPIHVQLCKNKHTCLTNDEKFWCLKYAGNIYDYTYCVFYITNYSPYFVQWKWSGYFYIIINKGTCMISISLSMNSQFLCLFFCDY